jgi:hypothetical protein
MGKVVKQQQLDKNKHSVQQDAVLQNLQLLCVEYEDDLTMCRNCNVLLLPCLCAGV